MPRRRHLTMLLLFAASAPACGGSSAEDGVAAGVDAGVDAPVDAAPDAPDAAPPTQASFTVEKTFTIASAGGGHLAFPDVTRLADGRLLLVYRRGASHVDPTGRIMKQFGTADGMTWTAAEVLYDAPGIDDRDPSITTLASGDVLVDYFQYLTMALPDGTMAVHHVFVGRSTDSGKTFGPFSQVDPGSMSPSNPKLDATGTWVDGTNAALEVRACSSRIVERGGELALPAYGGRPLDLANLAKTPRSRVSTFVSANGQTWTEEPVLAAALPSSWLQEPALLRFEDGTTVMQIRTALGSSPSNAGPMMQSTSNDDGKTWSAPASMGFVGHAPNLARLESGLLLSGYRELDAALTKESVAFSWSLDGAKTWTGPVEVQDCKAVECGYPSIVELDPQRFLLVYYAPGGTAIKAVVYRYTLS